MFIVSKVSLIPAVFCPIWSTHAIMIPIKFCEFNSCSSCDLLISDYNNSRVQHVTPSGEFISSIGVGELFSPCGLAVLIDVTGEGSFELTQAGIRCEMCADALELRVGPGPTDQ